MLGLLVAAACGDDGGVPSDEADPEPECESECFEPEYDPPTISCEQDEECPDTQRCFASVCEYPPEGYCDESIELDSLGVGFGSFPIATDVDGDGRDEIVAFVGDSVRTIFYASPTMARVIETPSVGLSLGTAADLDGDELVDLIAPVSDEIVVLLGDGTGGFAEQGRFEAAATAVAVGDFDANGTVDIAAPSSVEAATWIFLGDGALGFPREPLLDLPSAGFGLAVGELDGTPGDDVIVSELELAVGVGASTEGWSDIATWPRSVMSPRVGDLNRDGRDEILGVDGDAVWVWTGESTHPFASGDQYRVPRLSGGVTAVGDFIGDAATDLVVASGGIVVFERALGCWTVLGRELGPWYWMETLDFDGDGVEDIGYGGDDGITIFFGE